MCMSWPRGRRHNDSTGFVHRAWSVLLASPGAQFERGSSRVWDLKHVDDLASAYDTPRSGPQRQDRVMITCSVRQENYGPSFAAAAPGRACSLLFSPDHSEVGNTGDADRA